LQQHVDPLYYNRPLEQRFEIAISLSAACSRNVPEVVKTALGEVTVSSAALRLRTSNGRTLLHVVARSIGIEWMLTHHDSLGAAKTPLAGT